MADARERLIRCFSTVFPELGEEEIVKASAEDGGNWDSLSAVTLLALVEEEFGIGIEVDNLDGAISFERLLACVKASLGNDD